MTALLLLMLLVPSFIKLRFHNCRSYIASESRIIGNQLRKMSKWSWLVLKTLHPQFSEGAEEKHENRQLGQSIYLLRTEPGTL